MILNNLLKNFLLLGFLFLPGIIFSQESQQGKKIFIRDSVTKENINRKAKFTALYSAVIPGLGQIRNDQILKAPIIWGGIGVIAYFAHSYHQDYKTYKSAYLYRTDNDTTTIDIFDPDFASGGVLTISTDSRLKSLRNENKRFRDLNIIVGTLFYLAQIIDAYVYAHLKEFDISDDLSLRLITPNFSNIAFSNSINTGIVLKFK